MSLKTKVFIAFSFSLLLLLTQAFSTIYFVNELQSEVSKLSQAIEAKNAAYDAIELAGQFNTHTAIITNKETLSTQLDTLNAYKAELDKAYNIIQKNTALLDKKSVDRLHDYIQFTEEFSKLIAFSNKGDSEAIGEQAIFLQDNIADIKELYSILSLNFSTAQAEALKREQAIHNKPSSAAIVITAASVFLLGIYGLIFARQLVSPIQVIAKRLQLISERQLNHEPLTVSGCTEILQLANATNVMQAEVTSIISEIQNAANILTPLAQAAIEVSTRTEQLTNQQQNAISEVATAVTEMSASSSEVSNTTLAADELADQANQQTLAGKRTVAGVADTVRQLSSEIHDSSDVLNLLANDVNDIKTVLDVINSIAEQTNLLALNASIEAARAGDQGRGFAVVADEVRTLAHRTSESTHQIQGLVEKLVSCTDKAVQSMKKATNRSSETVSQANNAGDSLEEITQVVYKINEINSQIATSAIAQTNVAQEIDKTIIYVNNLAVETFQTSQRVATSNEEFKLTATNLNNLANRFKLR